MTVEYMPVIAHVVVGDYSYPVVEMESVDSDGLINAAFSMVPEPHIRVNRAAWSLPPHVRLAIIGHELGHDLFDHWGLERSLENEIEADTFAVKVAGVEAVRQLFRTMIKSLTRRGYDPGEVEIRLQHLPEPEPQQLQCPRKRLPCGKKRRRNRRGRRR